MLAAHATCDAALSDHEVERHIVRSGCDALHFLRCVTDSDEQGRMPDGAQPPEAEREIVVAASHAQANAVTIEADERQEHDIEQACARQRRSLGLDDAEAIHAMSAHHHEGPVRDLNEAHGAHSRATIDVRQIHAAAAAQRERDEAGGVELFGGRRVDADALIGTEIEGVIGMARNLPGGTYALCGG